ncbi:DUF4892 domain-containing protein [Aestuariicella hydrocarbonica]|uniref:DUF4892 domain-containing protein n=1 Tax=Pseudomaricurvus hydrocarbonicus TaxID=1470433 RepID=A0A9E5JPU5_9GAMM|nr:DUF4892 domain-containing protein [Aestuariicella hydrocarbonica]NHO64407.1 DUF4892 domain-containing protein [Aestuariicella hydrocarbonica]
MKSLICVCVAFISIAYGISASALSLARYEQARVVAESRDQVTDYRLALGALKKVDSDWRAEREQRLSGVLDRLTLELDEGQSEQEAFEFYRRQMLQMGGQELFLCESRRCGSSGAWANSRFGVRQLYGLDQYQYYSAIGVNLKDGKQAYVALYAVQRGNKRRYLQVDILTTTQPVRLFSSSEVIEERLRVGREFILPELLNEQLEQEQLKAVVSALKSQRNWHIAIVGFDVGTGTLQQQQDRSLAAAKAVYQKLIAEGLDGNYLSTYGMGGLAPNSVPDGRERSVNLVKIVPSQ